MANGSKNRYYVKNAAGGSFEEITQKFNGVAVLMVTGLDSKGKAINIYNEQWINSQTEDYMVTGGSIVRENVDIEITFIVKKKYASSPSSNFSVLSVHDTFVNYMTNTDVWIKSNYLGGKYVHCVCLNEYKPTTIKLDRGDESYMMGTITLHSLTAPSS